MEKEATISNLRLDNNNPRRELQLQSKELETLREELRTSKQVEVSSRRNLTDIEK